MYSLGLGAFLAAGLAFGRLADAFGWVKRHFTALTLAATISMAFFGCCSCWTVSSGHHPGATRNGRDRAGPAGPARLREEHDMADPTSPKGRPTNAREARAAQARCAKVRARPRRHRHRRRCLRRHRGRIRRQWRHRSSRFDLPALDGPGRVQLTALHGKPWP